MVLENVCSCGALIGGVEVKCKEVLDGVLKSVQVQRFLLHQEPQTLTYGQCNEYQ